MITGVHTMFFTSRAEELRIFLRDKLGFPGVDVGEGWLIFDLPPAEMGCHPDDPAHGQHSGLPYISFICDDIAKTVAELGGRGVVFVGEIEDRGYGHSINFQAPGDFTVELYQPKYKK
jgi:catechol 2,3-dioxygenase-like lactoylglutathione lyase family enzyme